MTLQQRLRDNLNLPVGSGGGDDAGGGWTKPRDASIGGY